MTADDYVLGRASKAHKSRGRIHLQFNSFRGVAQLVARDVWDVDAAGSNPVTPTKIGFGKQFPKPFSLFSATQILRADDCFRQPSLNVKTAVL